MSKDWYVDVLEFKRDVRKDNIPSSPVTGVSFNDYHLCCLLIEEEIDETLNAMSENDLAKIADGIVDSIVVLIGAAITHGIDIRPIWDEVHRTNMAKKGGSFEPSGKLLKPEGWEPPRIKKLILSQMLEDSAQESQDAE